MARCARSAELRGDIDRLGVARVRTRATTPGLFPSCWFRARAIDGQRSIARLSVCWWLAACDIHMLPLTSKIKGETRTPIFYNSLKLEITFCVQGIISPVLANLYMNRFLKYWRQTGRGEAWKAHIINYADDFVILSCGHAAEALEWTDRTMTRLGLSLNRT